MTLETTLGIDPATGVLTIDDGSPGAAPSVATGLALWTLRTPLGRAPVDRSLGVDWRLAQVDGTGAGPRFRRELERAMWWIVDAGHAKNLAVTVTTVTVRGVPRLSYVIAFDGTAALRGTA